nr:hypothetical protein [Propionibacteriaceae bacterium]
MRDKADIPIPAPDAAFLERSISKVRELPNPQQWRRQHVVGGGYLLEDALAEATKGKCRK